MRTLHLVYSAPSEDCHFDPVVQALLEHVRPIVPLPQAVSARVIARARASIAGRGASPTPIRLPPRRD